VLVLSAVAVAVGVARARAAGAGIVAYDFYGQFYPWVLQAQRGLAGGGGMLWNPYQECGQPLFANIQTGFLNPVNAVFWIFPREPAALLCIVLNLSIAGAGTFALGRAIGLTPIAALCGALAFQLGWAATTLATWSPTHLGTLVWLPVVMWRCERLVRAPRVRQGILMGLALTAQLLAGFPQILVFTYQLVALRIGWALVLRQAPRVARLLGAAAIGVLVPPLLAAVQLLPALEVARRSLWGSALPAEQLGSTFSWSQLGSGLASDVVIGGQPLLIALVAGALIGTRSRHRSDVVFYVLVACVSFVLSLGPGSLLYWLYEHLPLASAFRGSARLRWVTSFALAMLVGLASDTLLRPARARGASRAMVAGIVLTVAVLVSVLGARGLGWLDWLLVIVLVGAIATIGRPTLGRWAPLALPLLILANYALVGLGPIFGLRQGDVYGAHADVFAFVLSRLTPQDRVLIVSTHPDLALMPKSGTVLAIPNVHDYDPLVSRHYAEFFTFMRTGHPFRGIDDWYWLFGQLLQPELQRRLFDRTAARYLIVDQRLDRTAQAFGRELPLLLERGGVRVYENVAALPRARFVGRVQLEDGDGAQGLARLAEATIDARRVALVDRMPPSGFAGADAEGGSVDFLVDEPDRVVLHMHAPAAGFLLLADQYDPGWSATVNGAPVDLLRADHIFRAVEVPAGDSEVVFSYRPWGLRVGALVSCVTALCVIVLWRRSGRRPHDGQEPADLQTRAGAEPRRRRSATTSTAERLPLSGCFPYR
jgi:hypothetical protein